MRAQTIATAGVILKVNGRTFGRVRTFEYAVDSPKKAIYGVDSLEPFELAPMQTKVSGKMTLYRTVGDGGVEGAGMAGILEEIPKEKYFSLLLLELISGTVVFQANYCSVLRQSWSVGEKGLVGGAVDFEALDWSNEIRPAK